MDKVAISIVKRDKKWVPIVVGVMIACFAVMYLVSWPYHGAPIDTQEGAAAMQCYRDQFGVIQTIGLGAKAGPYGETVRPCTVEDAQEYQRQSGGRERNFLDGLFGDQPEAMALHADVEQVEILPNKTVLHFAVKRINNFRSGRFYRPHGWNYLSDETGQTYDLLMDGATYPDWVDAKTHKDFDHSDKQHAETRIVRPDEIYRFTAEYAPLKPGINHLRLHDSRFGEVSLDYLLAQGKIAAQIQAEAWAEAEARTRAEIQAQQAQAEAQAREQQSQAEAQVRAQRAQAEAEARAQIQAQERQAQAEAAQARERQAQAEAWDQVQAQAQRAEAGATRGNIFAGPIGPMNFPQHPMYCTRTFNIGGNFRMKMLGEFFNSRDGSGYTARVFVENGSGEGRWVGDYEVYHKSGRVVKVR